MGRVEVRVQPRARRSEVAGVRDGRLLIRVTAPPVDGKANEAVRKLIAGRLGVPPGRVVVVRGESARDKLIEVEGLDEAAVRRVLRPGPIGPACRTRSGPARDETLPEV